MSMPMQQMTINKQNITLSMPLRRRIAQRR